MSSRKKGKKTKGQTVNLTEFLASGGTAVPIKPTWGDEVEDEHEMGYMGTRISKEPVVLPTAPRAARGPGVDEENIPTNPPYVAYLSNLPYDIIEEDLDEFFEGMGVSNMRLPKDSSKGKGYGYVEFTNRQSLIDALSMSNIMIKTRRVRIEVSNSSMGRENRRDNYDNNDSERTTGDWRSRPRDDPSGGDDRFRSRGYDSRDRRDDRDTGESEKPSNWREGNRAPVFSDRRGYRGDDDRRGFRGDDERSGLAGGERRGFRDDGPRRGYRDDDRDNSRDRNTSGTWRSEAPPRSAEPPPPSEPRTRPKLKLQPRSKPLETEAVHPAPNGAESQEEKIEEKKDEQESTSAQPPVPAANIFGAAKPVDTAAREREIEERLAKTSVEKTKEDGEPKAAWTRRNGDGRDKERPRPTWRSDEDRGRPVDRRQDRQDRQEYRRPTSGRSDDYGDSRGDSRDPPASRSGGGSYRSDNSSSDSRRPPPIRTKYRDDGPAPMAKGADHGSRSTSERVRRSKDREDSAPPMPKATDQQAPNFIASNKYSMLHEDDDNIDD